MVNNCIKKKKDKEKTLKSFFFESYSLSWKFLKEARNFIYVVILVFLVFSFIGFFVSPPPGLEAQLLKFIEELIEKTSNMSQAGLILYIFENNLQSSFFGLFLGFFLGIFPLMASVANGYLLGFVSSTVVREEGFLVLWRLFPHGIFELPAVFISLGLGLRLGTFLFRRKKAEFFRDCFMNSLRIFVFIVIPLLVIAAIIEGSLIALAVN